MPGSRRHWLHQDHQCSFLPLSHGTPRIYGSQHRRAEPQQRHPCVPVTPDTITGARPPSARTRAASAAAPGTSSPTAGQAGIPPPTPDPVADCALRTSIFYTYVKINGQVCKLIVDSGSCVNAVSDTMIPRLGLATHPHPVLHQEVTNLNVTLIPRQRRQLMN